MMKQRWLGPGEWRMFRHYLKRYLVVALLVVLCCIPFGVGTYSWIRSYAERQNQREMMEYAAQCNQEMDKMLTIAKVLGEDNHVLDIERLHGSIPANKQLSLKTIGNKIFEILSLTDYSSAAFMLFRNNPAIITQGQVAADVEKYYGSFLQVADYSLFDLRSMIFSDSSGAFCKWIRGINYYDKGVKIQARDAVLFVVPVAMESILSEPKAAIVFVIGAEKIIAQLLPGNLSETAAIMITDNDGNTILSAGKQEIIEKESYQTLDIGLDSCGLNLAVFFSKAQLYNSLSSVMKMLLIYIIIGIILALGFTFVYTLRLFKPYRAMMKKISEVSGVNMEDSNDYDYITSSVLKLVEDKHEMEAKVLLAENDKQVILLENIFTSGFSDPETEEQFAQQYPFTCMGYYIAVLQMNPQGSSADSQMALMYGINSLEKEYPEPFLKVYPRNGRAILLLADAGMRGESAVMKYLQTAMNKVHVEWQTHYTIGISKRQEKLQMIDIAASQARQTMMAWLSNSESCVRFWEKNDKQQTVVFHIEQLEKLAGLISNGHTDAVMEFFRQLDEEIAGTPEHFRLKKQEIYYAITHLLRSICEKQSVDDLMSEITLVELQKMTLEQCIQLLRSTALRICDAVTARKNDRHRELKQQVIAYIEQEFHRSEMNASLVARELGTSEKYVYAFVKEETGDTFSAYLEKVRIQCVKDCLLKTDWSNERIAEQSGFGSVNAFYRIFKKCTGLSPNQFRKGEKHGVVD